MATALVDFVEWEIFLAGPPRCAHSVMLFGDEIGTGKSNYCLSCTPSGPQNTRNLVMSRFSDHPLTAPEHRANLNSGLDCPGCHSRIHIVESDKVWVCAECGEKYPAYDYVRKYR